MERMTSRDVSQGLPQETRIKALEAKLTKALERVDKLEERVYPIINALEGVEGKGLGTLNLIMAALGRGK